MKTIKSIIVDDHFLVRVGLANTFATDTSDIKIEVVAEAASAKEFYDIFEQGIEADVVLLDINLPDQSGIEVARHIKNSSSELKVLMLSAENSPETMEQIMTVNIDGFISKGGTSKELYRAIESVVDGIDFFGKDIATLMHNVRVSKPEIKEICFTPKEVEVLQLAAQGLYSKEIADKLNMSTKTVSVHKSNIFKKLGINNSVELVRYAIKSGLVRV